MNSTRVSLYVSLSVHAVAFGALALTGVLRQPGTVASGNENLTIELTVVAAPDETPTKPAEAKPNLAATSPAPLAQTFEPVAVAPVPRKEAVPEPTVTSPASMVKQRASSFFTKSSALENPLPLPASAAIPLNPTHPGGDASFVPPGEPPATNHGGMGVRAVPEYRKNPEPSYPVAARRRHQEGLVLVSVVVTSAGRPARVEIKESSGFPLLDDAAIEAVKGWEFEPARLDSVAVESKIEVPLRFKLAP